MSSMQPHPLPSSPLAVPTAMQRGLGWYLAWAVVALVLAASWQGADMRPLDLLHDTGNMAVFASEFLAPDFSDWRLYVQEMLITLQIAVWGTALALVSAIPLGLMASSNLAPWWICQPTRRLLDVFRAVNEMIFAMLFVVVVGLGPFAGVLALWVGTTGVLAKMFSEAVEAIDQRPIDGIRSTGASALHEIIYGVIPQVIPLWSSYTLYNFESNVRSATVVGMVGAGGIGTVMWEIIRGFQFAETAAVLIIIIGTVTVIDLISARIRKLTL